MKNSTEIDVLLHVPGTSPRKLSSAPTMTLGEMLRKAGVGAELLVFAAEDSDVDCDDEADPAPLSLEITIGSVAKGRVATIHCHRCRQIHVTVNYQSRTVDRRFPAATRVQRVLRWSKRKLKLTDADADNLVLFLCEGREKLRENLHVGELVTGKECALCFNLSKDVNIEGVA